jgi:hypothetical protein
MPYLFSPREIARSMEKKEFESFSGKKQSPSTQVGRDYLAWCGSDETAATAPTKNGDGLAACPHFAAACPHPAAVSSTLL